jgi:hypothetical protein
MVFEMDTQLFYVRSFGNGFGLHLCAKRLWWKVLCWLDGAEKTWHRIACLAKNGWILVIWFVCSCCSSTLFKGFLT